MTPEMKRHTKYLLEHQGNCFVTADVTCQQCIATLHMTIEPGEVCLEMDRAIDIARWAQENPQLAMEILL